MASKSNRNGIGNGNGMKVGEQQGEKGKAGSCRHLSWLRPQFLQHFASYISVLIRSSKSCCALWGWGWGWGWHQLRIKVKLLQCCKFMRQSHKPWQQQLATFALDLSLSLSRSLFHPVTLMQIKLSIRKVNCATIYRVCHVTWIKIYLLLSHFNWN